MEPARHGPEPLRRRLDAVPRLTPAQAARICARLLAALAARGAPHGRLSPERVRLGADGEVTLVAPEGTEPAPGYLAPEQALGEEIDARADVFVAGVMLYEMLAGRRPFEGRTAGETISALLVREPPPLRALRPDVTGQVEAIVTRALAKRPAERWATAEDMRAALEVVSDPHDMLPPTQAAAAGRSGGLASAEGEGGGERPTPRDGADRAAEPDEGDRVAAEPGGRAATEPGGRAVGDQSSRAATEPGGQAAGERSGRAFTERGLGTGRAEVPRVETAAAEPPADEPRGDRKTERLFGAGALRAEDLPRAAAPDRPTEELPRAGDRPIEELPAARTAQSLSPIGRHPRLALVAGITLIAAMIAWIVLRPGRAGETVPDGTAPPALVAGLRATLARGELAAARTQAESIARAYPNDARVFALLGGVLFAQGEKERALAAYREAHHLDRSVGATPELLANLRATFADPVHGEAAFRLAEAIGPPARPILSDLAAHTQEARLKRRAADAMGRITQGDKSP